MKKYVITGGPVSGKSSVIDELDKLGLFVLPETATQIIKIGKYGDIKKLSREKILEFNEEVIYRKFEKEVVGFKKEKDCVFLDRAMPDSKAYFSFYGLPLPIDFVNYDFSQPYDLVFMFQRLPFKNDEGRVETDEKVADGIHNEIIKTYKELNYKIIDVPLLSGNEKESIEMRVEFILDKISSPALL